MNRLELLRVHQAQILEILEATTAPSSLAKVLRTALDPRPLSARIAWSVRFACAGLVSAEYDEPKLLVRAQIRLGDHWSQLPLDRMPCDKSIASVLRTMHAEKLAANLPEIPPHALSVGHRSTVAST